MIGHAMVVGFQKSNMRNSNMGMCRINDVHIFIFNIYGEGAHPLVMTTKTTSMSLLPRFGHYVAEFVREEIDGRIRL